MDRICARFSRLIHFKFILFFRSEDIEKRRIEEETV